SSAGSEDLADNPSPTLTLDQAPDATTNTSQNQTTLHPLNYRPERPRFAASSPEAASLKMRKNPAFERFDVPASNAILAALDQEANNKQRSLRLGFSVSPLTVIGRPPRQRPLRLQWPRATRQPIMSRAS